MDFEFLRSVKNLYYFDGRVAIINDDCRNVIAFFKEHRTRFNLMLCDPPYGVGKASGTRGIARKHKHVYSKFEDTLENVRDNIIPVFTDFMTICDRSVVTPGPKAMCYYPQPDSFGTFYQPAACGMQKWGYADAQPIFYYGRDPRVGKTISASSYKLTERPPKNGHPCPKPIKAWTWLLNKASVPGECIIDPFMGSGTTLAIAREAERFAVGIEIEEEYCEIAVKSLRQNLLEL